MSFPCTGCGLCCMKAGKAVEGAKALIRDKKVDNPYVREVAAFPFQYDQDGRCEMLGEDHRCKVYDQRPDICKIDVTWEKYHSSGISLENYYRSTITVCNDLMAEAGNYDNFFIELQNG